MDDKKTVREKALHIRKELSPELRIEKSQHIADALEGLPEFKDASHVLFYYTHGTEVDTISMIHKYLESKQLYLPVIENSKAFKAVPVKAPLELSPGKEGVPEPIPEDPDAWFEDQLDCIIIPGVAFAPDGTRLGMGKGYYDRYLKKLEGTTRIALAFQEQIFDRIPKEPYDEPVDIIVTDEKVIRCHS